MNDFRGDDRRIEKRRMNDPSDICTCHQKLVQSATDLHDRQEATDKRVDKKMSSVGFIGTISVVLTVLVTVFICCFSYTSNVKTASAEQTEMLRESLVDYAETLSTTVAIQNQITKSQDRMQEHQAEMDAMQHETMAIQGTILESVKRLEYRMERYHPVN